MTDAVTISRETLQAAIDALECALSDSRPYIVKSREVSTTLRAALAAQPAEPVATSYADYQQRIGAPLTFFTSVAAQAYRAAATRDDVTHEDAMRVALQAVQGAAPPAPVPPDPAAEMDAVAIRYAHKMALDLECILAEYGGSWYNTAMQTLGEYRSEMNAIHERECPTFMGEPVIAAAGDKP